ncbi:MAG: amino acid adenylation domain-containing protein [Acidobacteriota bacterium]|nr:amino acid adenylation domain-containing protein [Acidobacteriota bacterium]
MDSLVHRLRSRSSAEPHRRALVFLADGEEEAASLTRGELDLCCRTLAAQLQQRLEPGRRALLLYSPGLPFIVAYLACLYAGVVAVPAYPPQRPKDFQRTDRLIRDCRPSLVLTEERLSRRLAAKLEEPHPPLLVTDAIEDVSEEEWREPELEAESLAFLQYTSGSTGDPKGVRITHGNLLANEAMMQRAFEVREDSRVVGWLPLYHDMGLIGNVLQPLYAGAETVLMAPTAFLQRPIRWLRAIHRYRAEISGGPDFAYRLCAERTTTEERRDLDLSCWRIAFDGAEPVRAATLETFSQTFAAQGFQRRAFFPCYGLAEATLFVAGPPADQTPSLGQDPVSCGGTWLQEELGTDFAVVDTETRRPVPEGTEGEIWVRGPHVADGYWNRPELSAEVFEAYLADGEGPWLRTGDLGILADGELRITCRSKDLIILRGRNLYPQDLELAAEESHPALRTAGAAAFSVDLQGEERLILACEIDRRREDQAPEAAACIRRSLAEEFQVHPWTVEILRLGTLPRTSSGKVRRHRCRQLFLASELSGVASGITGGINSSPSAPLSLEPAPSWEELEQLEPDEGRQRLTSFFRQTLGVALDLPPERWPAADEEGRLDSLRAVEARGRIQEALAVELPLELLLAGASARELAAEAWERRSGGEPPVRLPPPPTEPLPATAAGPLSHSQRSLWFLHRLHPQDPSYIVAVAGWLPVDTDLSLLDQAWHRLRQRHPALRTVFRWGPAGEPEQRMETPGPLEPVEESLAEGCSTEELLRRAEDFAWAPFDLEAGPPARLRVFQGGKRPLLVLAAHHIAVDLGSLTLLLQELAELMGGNALAPPPQLDPWSLQRWQKQILEGPRGRALEAFWNRLLPARPPTLELPADRELGHDAETAATAPALRPGAAEAVSLGREAQDRLSALARSLGTSRFTVVLSLFSAYLGRLAGQKRFAVGVPAANRSHPALRPVVGYLVNPLAVPVEIGAEETLESLIQGLTPTITGALEHQDYPFPLLVQRLAPQRQRRHPIFQVAVAYESRRGGGANPGEAAGEAALVMGESGPAVRLRGLSLEPVALEHRPCPFDVVLMVAEGAAGSEVPSSSRLHFSWRYRRDRFDEITARRMAQGFGDFLATALGAPEARLSSLHWLSPAQRHQLAVEWNDTETGFSRRATVDRLIFEQSKCQPEAVAIVDAEGSLSYGRLAELAERVAQRLRGLPGAETPDQRVVAVCFERCPGAVVALLGTLRAGDVYLPIDPELPEERRKLLIRSAETAAKDLSPGIGRAAEPVVLVQERLEDRLPEAWRRRALVLDRRGELRSAPEPSPGAAARPPHPRSSPTPESLAYILFTSGSTGEPKGIAVSHRAVVRLVHRSSFWTPRASNPGDGSLEDGSPETVLQAAPLSFDASTFEIWGALANGARLALLPPGPPSARLLAETVARLQVTSFFLTTGLFRLLVDHAPEALAGRTVLTGGETMSPDHWVRGSAAVASDASDPGRLVNCYGPTECTTFATAGTPRPEIVEQSGSVPIGGPIGGTETWVLDGAGQLLPVGTVGELYLGGAGLAQGYLGSPAATAQHFLPHPFSPQPGERLYRTGDRARWRPEGSLDFRGRVDRQLKVRGHRVEPAEVERVLAGAPGVAAVAVVPQPDPGGGWRLVAHCAPGGVDPGELRAYAVRHLPQAMVPAVFVPRTTLPLNANGKVDRSALPELPAAAFSGDDTGDEIGGPASRGSSSDAHQHQATVEATVSAVWRRVLDLEHVPRHQSLFELGGHSLLAARIAAELEQELGRPVALITLFDHPTVADLSRYLEARDSAPPASAESSESSRNDGDGEAGQETGVDTAASPLSAAEKARRRADERRASMASRRKRSTTRGSSVESD